MISKDKRLMQTTGFALGKLLIQTYSGGGNFDGWSRAVHDIYDLRFLCPSKGNISKPNQIHNHSKFEVISSLHAEYNHAPVNYFTGRMLSVDGKVYKG